MELEVSDLAAEGWTVVTASGEIDVGTASVLRDRLTELVQSGSTRLIVDLEDIDFIDSTGLGVLVGAIRRARSADGEVRLVCTNSRILKVFDATGLDEVFTIAPSVAEAASVDPVD